ncbi:2-thiouracil desulfurase family protein [Photobacterium sp. S4TG1]|uniref:YbgA family protein n=1 Tax=Photobacterium sp. S4TG1 TaxID=3114587 RepID=UPI002E18DE86|nr:2-thiouracil desulfurase family protein [Photobacterium sp. S4TG1]
MGIPVGISACVLGQKVRFDGGHKRNRFADEELSEYFDFKPVCPEVGIGMTVPRPTIRLQDNGDRIALVGTKDHTLDYTDEMVTFADNQIPSFKDLRGYIVCAKSPTCGMERVKLYLDNGNSIPGGAVGIFTQRLMDKMPWLPIEEDGRLQDPVLRENFIFRIYALDDLYRSVAGGITRDSIIKFHSRYKLCLMAHDPQAYRTLGPFVSDIHKWDDLSAFFIEYRQRLMDALKNRASRKNNTNVLMHIQGYFKRDLDKPQKAELRDVIMRYREGLLPLIAPLTLINHYLTVYPDNYLADQAYLDLYPESLKLRYAL